ncbi:MAG: peptidylprolyl isomerase [Bacteroidetes bacterium]|nr:peptidylprolyl isomerase [Fibrella sp.]
MLTPQSHFLVLSLPQILRLLPWRLSGSLLASALVMACKTVAPPVAQQPAPTQPMILTLGTKSFPTDDFFQSFTKNQTATDSIQQTDIKDYLVLYTNLKLKVLAAEQQGRDTTEAFREEIATYRKQLAQSYLNDKVLIENLTAEAYQRLGEELAVSHLLIAVAEDAAPADTLAAYRQARDLRERLLKGDDFTGLARQFSKDPTVSRNNGNLGYITAFKTVYPVEVAAYSTPVGQISQPVRTRFGYHLLKVSDRRPGRGKIQVAHILLRLSPGADAASQTAVKTRIDEVYARLQKGESFETLCRAYSDDGQSKNAGGVLPYFGTNQNVPAFEEAAYALTTPGSYSKPVQTNYGWHILKLIDRKPLESYTDLAPALRQRVMVDTRGEVIRQASVQRLRKDYPVQTIGPVLQAALSKADTSLLAGNWKITEPLDATLEGKTLVTINGKSATVNQFFTYVRQRQQPVAGPGAVPALAMQRLYDRFVGDRLMAAAEANLDTKSPEFRALLNEIRDGVLLSQVMEEKVWGRSMADSVGQQQFYEQNKARYTLPERAFATVIVAQNDSVLNQTRRLLTASPYPLRRTTTGLSYEKGKTVLTPVQREALYEMLATMVKNQDYVLEVAGSREASEADSVSAGRLLAVVNYLTTNGIDLNRIIERDLSAYRPGTTGKDAQRRVTFQYFSTAKADVERVLNANGPVVSIVDGAFAKGADPHVDAVAWKPGTTTLHPGTKSVLVSVSRIDPARTKTFAEARGTVINEYQDFLEKQWLAQLRQQYPVQINDTEMRKLSK